MKKSMQLGLLVRRPITVRVICKSLSMDFSLR